MTLSGYLIDHSAIDWPVVFSDWKWLIPVRTTVWIMNRFGDLFVMIDDGTIHMFDVGRGTLAMVAENRQDFARLLNENGNADDWLMIPLIDELVAAGVELSDGQCYGYRLPPVIGGDYTLENTATLSIAEHYRFNAEIHRQIKDLPDGSYVTIDICD